MSSNEAHLQETGQFGFDRLNDTEGLTVSQSAGLSDNGWGALQFVTDTTVTVLSDARQSTGGTSGSYPAGFILYGLFHTTITISAGGDVVCYRRNPGV